MKYFPKTEDTILAAVTHGSHLYGTNTPLSDYDFKAVVLPRLDKLLLCKRITVDKYKFDAAGNPVPEDVSMPPDGYEAEHTSLQKFVGDYMSGQAYAVEFVYALKAGFATDNANAWWAYPTFVQFVNTLPVHRNVDGMVGFAMKQTFDYVRRGERYNDAVKVLEVVAELLDETASKDWATRLDTNYGGKWTILDEIADRTGLKMGLIPGTGTVKTMRTLKLNGREYLETTTIPHFKTAVEKLVASYGGRSTTAAGTEVEWKSLAHAVRVYQQVVELLTEGHITFPRPNAAELLAIRQEKIPLEEVKIMLRDLDDQVQVLVAESTLPLSNEELREEVERNLMDLLRTLYDL